MRFGSSSRYSATLADAGQPHRGDRERVERDRDRLAVEVAARADLVVVGQHDRVVRDGAGFGLQHALDVAERVAGRAVHLRRAPQRIRVLHQVRALAMRRQDRRTREQPSEVRRRRDLAGVRTQPLQPFVERGVGAERRLHRHRRGDVGRPREVGDAPRGQDPDREHALRPVDERQALLRLQRDRREAGHGERRAGRFAPLLGEQLALPDQREREVRQGRQVARRAQRPLLRHRGDQLAIQHLDHAIDDQRPHAGVPERQDVRSEQEHRSGLLAGQWASHGRRVRPHDAQLERGGLGRIDPHVGQGAEPGGDPVHRFAGRDDALDHRPGRLDPRPRRVRELDRGAARNGHDVRERQRSPHPDRHGGKATPKTERRVRDRSPSRQSSRAAIGSSWTPSSLVEDPERALGRNRCHDVRELGADEVHRRSIVACDPRREPVAHELAVQRATAGLVP